MAKPPYGSAVRRSDTKAASVQAVEKDVTFIDAEPGLNDQIDAAYRSKYHRYPVEYVDHVVAPVAQSATIRLVPR